MDNLIAINCVFGCPKRKLMVDKTQMESLGLVVRKEGPLKILVRAQDNAPVLVLCRPKDIDPKTVYVNSATGKLQRRSLGPPPKLEDIESPPEGLKIFIVES